MEFPVNPVSEVDIDLSLHQAIWAKQGFSGLMKESPGVSLMDELLDLVF